MSCNIPYILDENGDAQVIEEDESCNILITFSDGDNTLEKTDLASITLTLFDVNGANIINERNAQDVKDANGGTVTDAGVLTLRLDPADNAVQSESLAAGELEDHLIRIKWTWNDGVAVRTGVSESKLKVRKAASPS